jgi:hypothetical protein
MTRWLNLLLITATVIIAAMIMSGCAFMPDDAVPMTPPESYRAVWALGRGLHRQDRRLQPDLVVEGPRRVVRGPVRQPGGGS